MPDVTRFLNHRASEQQDPSISLYAQYPTMMQLARTKNLNMTSDAKTPPLSRLTANIYGGAPKFAPLNSDCVEIDPAPHHVSIAGLEGISFSRVGDDDAALWTLNGSVPEFLYQLTKMLTDGGNREVIEWIAETGRRFGSSVMPCGRIQVHNPKRMEEEVLGKYFRHSKYSSFQRQLNYFGFRKLAGKGKMSPCSYINEMATSDIRSLLLIKRKVPASTLENDAKTCSPEFNSPSIGSIDKSAGKKNKCLMLTPESQTAPSSGDGTRKRVSNASSLVIGSAAVGHANVKKSKTELSNCLDQNISKNSITAFGSNICCGRSSNKIVGDSSGPREHLPISYTVAIGRGVKHQLNGFLKKSHTSSSNKVTESFVTSTPSCRSNPFHTTASTISTSSSTSNAASVTNSEFTSYLAHPSCKLASSIPAPLQFLDPSELGMSIETSLTQLKSNFQAANRMVAESSSRLSSVNDPLGASATIANATSYGNPNTTLQTRNMEMLSRDDSLVDLAMLPILDVPDPTQPDTTGVNNATHRDDWLADLAASVARRNPVTKCNAVELVSMDTSFGGSRNSSVFDFSPSSYDDGVETFSFIDFPGQL